jgi:hypothetical protein
MPGASKSAGLCVNRLQAFFLSFYTMGLFNKLFGTKKERPLSSEELLQDIEVLPEGMA